MDLAGGHIQALEALDRDEIFTAAQASAYGGSGGKYKAYNVSRVALEMRWI